jgi:hypothetical protein
VLMKDWKFSDYVLLVLNGKSTGIIEQLTKEDAPGKIHAMQGRLEGLKLLRDKIVTEFGDLSGTMSREDIPSKIDSIGKQALENFNYQILQDSATWRRISEFISSCDDKEMKDLYESTEAVTRDMKRAHGKRDGLRIAENLMDEISETLDHFRANPDLPGIEEEENQGVIEFPEEEPGYKDEPDGNKDWEGETPDKMGETMGVYEPTSDNEEEAQ